jgi:lipoprotein signal peptidase
MDQLTKYQAEKHLMVWQHDDDLRQYHGTRVPLWVIGEEPHLDPSQNRFYLAFSLNYIRNQGAAWGFLSDWDDHYRIPFFYIMTIMAIFLIGYYFFTTPAHHRLARLAFALVMSGALGNFTDRVLRGYVIDFLDVRWSIPLPWQLRWAYNFPNFNWADSCITIGVGLLLIDLLVLEGLRAKKLRGTSNSYN